MADETEGAEDAPKKTSKKALIIGAVLALVLGAGGFYAVFSGAILGGSSASESHAAADAASEGDSSELETALAAGSDLTEVAFIPVAPIVVSLTGSNASRHLRFRAELEVGKEETADVEQLMPRVVDVMNAYLRAVDPNSLDAPGALIELRAQLLRRVALVVGANRVRDILVMEFVLS